MQMFPFFLLKDNTHLESIKAPCLRHLNLSHEPLDQILIDNPIGGSKECQNVGNEVALLWLELVPVVKIL